MYSAPSLPTYWDRYVDDTWALINKGSTEELNSHLNDIEPQIQFTIEEP